MKSNMPVDFGRNVPKVSIGKYRLTTCSSWGRAAIQSIYLSAVRGYRSQSVRANLIEMSSVSLSLVSSNLSFGEAAEQYT